MAQNNQNKRPVASTDEEILRARLTKPPILNGPITLVEYDLAWPTHFLQESGRIRQSLGDRVLLLEHVGSTSVPGLLAKPIIDILLVVANSADESSYVPSLEAAGYVLAIREPEWHEHRVLAGSIVKSNVHVFSLGSSEIERLLSFRKRLRENQEDRNLYAQTKRKLAAQRWKYMQQYADAKSEVVESILARATVV